MIPLPQAEIAVVFGGVLHIRDSSMIGNGSIRPSARYWGDQSLCDAMTITGIVRDRRTCYRIRHGRRATTPNTSDFTQLFPLLSLLSPNPSPHITHCQATKQVTYLPRICHSLGMYGLYITAASACRLFGHFHTSDSVYGD